MTMILSDIASRLASGSLSARDHVESCLAAIDCEDGARAFITVNAETARKQANRIDKLRSAGAALPPSRKHCAARPLVRQRRFA